MATLSLAWSITAGALAADQAAINVTANNTANVNTPGYTREAAMWQEDTPVSINGMTFGRGASMIAVASQRDRVLEQRLQQKTQEQQATSARLNTLQSLEGIFSPSGTSAGASGSQIGSAMSSFFDALSSLSSNPSDVSSRESVLSAANSLAESFQSATTQIGQVSLGLNEQVGIIVNQVNALTRSLAGLNQQITTQSPNADASALEDQRQLDLTQLSQLIGVHQIQTENNGLTITTGGGNLLATGALSYPLTTGLVAGSTHVFTADGTDITAELTTGGGQLGGILTSRDQDIPQMQSSLDTLAYAVGSAINQAQLAGSDANGNAGGPMFSVPGSAAGAAGSISVLINDPEQIAAAAPGLGSSDNSNLTAMVDLENSPVVGGISPTNYYSDFITAVGSLTSQTSTLNDAEQASLTQLQDQRDALSSVNLNDEAASLENLERSYQAASKVFSVLNSVMASALNLGTQTTVS